MIWQGEHCPNCESHAREAKRWRERAEHYSDQWTAVGTKGQAIIDELCAENKQLHHDLERQMSIANEHVNEVERLREAMRTVEQGVPRLVGKSWFPDGRPSKHDQCVHGIWMYEPCEGCTDAFIAEALGGTK